ncbi:hypothetical protein K9M74_02810 [Candidatus Woesearchaeota archaeon]|nr:hypothetical protein [Candidatus Woesearchaeota archaeon]
MVFASKKGMSPLIATVLLIAFAVALGAMIMNWSAGVAPEDELGKTALCESIALDSESGVCIADTKLMFSVKNIGDESIQKVKLIIVDAYGETSTTLSQGKIIPGETVEQERPYVYDGGAFKLELVPLIDDGTGEYVQCATSYVQETLPSC